MVERFTYDKHYGKIITHTKTVETDNPYAYTGRVFDTAELYYYRARYYDPTLERFISEDPIGFASGDFNWYRYVGNDPVDLVDPWGLWDLNAFPNPNGVIPGGPWEPNVNGRPGSFLGPKIKGLGRPLLQYVPDELNGGPRGAKTPYWKVKIPGQKGWQRYNMCGKPITPEEAHPGPDAKPEPPKRFPWIRSKPTIVWWCLIFCPTPAY